MPLFLLLPAFLICLFLPHMRHRKTVLYLNLGLLIIYSICMIHNGVAMGAMVYIIGMVGTFSQIIFPEKKSNNPKTYKNIRIGIACCVATIGAITLYSSPIDLIAISGFFAARLAETADKPRNITKGYLVSASFFLTFAIMNGIWVVVGLQIVLISSILFAFNRKRIKSLFKVKTTSTA